MTTLNMKAFRMNEAERCGLHPNSVARRIQQGIYSDFIEVVRKNARVVFVKIKSELPQYNRYSSQWYWTGLEETKIGRREYMRKYYQMRKNKANMLTCRVKPTKVNA